MSWAQNFYNFSNITSLPSVLNLWQLNNGCVATDDGSLILITVTKYNYPNNIGIIGRSTDLGKTFTLNYPTVLNTIVWNSTNNFGFDMDMSYDGSYVYIVVSSGVYLSTDKAFTFSLLTSYQNGFVACSRTGQYVCIGPYVSSNYGSTWTSSTGLFKFSGGSVDSERHIMKVSDSGKNISIISNYNRSVNISTNYGLTYYTANIGEGFNTNNNQYFYGVVISDDIVPRLFVSTNIGVFNSTDGGVTWNTGVLNSNIINSTNNTVQIMAGSSDLTQIIVGVGGNVNTSISLFLSYNTLTNYFQYNLPSGYYSYNPLYSTRNGDILLYQGSYQGTPGLYTYVRPKLIDQPLTINGTLVPANGTYTAIARTRSVNVSVSPSVNVSVQVTGTTGLDAKGLNDDLNTITVNLTAPSYTPQSATYYYYVMVLRNCFKEDTKILCFIDNEEKYVPIQDLRKGTLVKTQVNGYVPVHTIGHSKIYNSDNKLRSMNRLFKCTKENYPEITEDLIITGCHGILVDEEDITMEVRRKTKELTRDDVWQTGKKFRLLTCIDEKAEPYEVEGTFPIWHLALDHYDRFMNYGIYANGLLVETCDINTINEFSGLELIE
jgi:hypothetical protein